LTPFKGGVLVPSADIVNAPLTTDEQGDLVITGPWPDGLSGTAVFMQTWLQDPAAPAGWSASNALSAKTP
jgi:hypothetical protein